MNVQLVNNLVDQALALLKAGRSIEALSTLTPALSSGVVVRDLRHIEGLCYLAQNKKLEALTALREEVKQFPANDQAKNLCSQIEVEIVMERPVAPEPVPAANPVQEARRFLSTGKAQEALNVTIEAKKSRKVIKGLDYVRAECFVALGRVGDARESLREELRFFPGDQASENLLAKVMAQESEQSNAIPHDPEFRELLAAVRPFTMLPEERLYAVYALAKQVCQNDLPGNFVECGVAGGGSTAVMATMIKRYSKRPRKVFAFDSFSGMPDPTENDTIEGKGADATGWGSGTCAAPEENVNRICKIMEVGDLVFPVKGFFEQTLPAYREQVGTLAFLHADCDWYESTKTIFNTIYDNVTPGGVIVVDDYGYWEGVKKALDEFQSQRKLNLPVHQLAGSAWFQKPAAF